VSTAIWPSSGGRILAVALAPCAPVTCTCAWQMSLLAFSPSYTPVVGSAAQVVCVEENAGGVTRISEELTTLKLVAGTPPKVTVVAPVKPEPRIVSCWGELSRPAAGATPVTLGTAPASPVSTYSKVEAAPGALDSPSASVTITFAGPAPSSGAEDSGGSVSLDGGILIVT
jgi:hypothetical protein